MMEVRGTLSSWLTMARKSARSRSVSSTAARSCRVTMKDSTAPSSPRMGAALSSTVTLLPSGTRSTISSAWTVSGELSSPARGNSRSDTSRPSARRKVTAFSRSSSVWPESRRRSTMRMASRLKDTGSPVAGVQDRNPHRGGLDQRLQTGPGPALLPVAPRVGDGQGRLGGEQRQRLLVLRGELLPVFLLRQEDAAHPLTQVQHRGRQEGDPGAHRQRGRHLGQAQGPQVAQQVGDPQGAGNPAQVMEVLRASPESVHTLSASSRVMPEERKSPALPASSCRAMTP